MTHLTQKEREDLNGVFASISEGKPTFASRINKLQIIIHLRHIFRAFSLSRKRTSYQK